MYPLLALTLLLIAGIGAARLLVPRPALRVPLPAPLAAVFSAGAPFILLGIVLGPRPALGVLDDAALRALTPIAALGVGWIGAVFGTRLEWRMMRRVPLLGWARGAALAIPVFLVTALAVWGLTRAFPPLAAAWHPAKAAILTLAAAATVSSGLSRVKAARRAGLFDTMLAGGAAAAALALVHPHPLRAVLVTLVVSGGAAALWLFVRPRDGIALGALVLLAAGFAYAAGLSPFVVCALLTALIVSFGTPDVKHFVAVQLAAWEPVVYAAFLIVAGALMRLPTAWLLAAGVGLAVLRSALRWATVRFGARWKALAALPPAHTFVTVGQGAAAVAIAAGFDLARADGSGRAVLTTVLISMLTAEVIAAALAPLTASARVPEVT